MSFLSLKYAPVTLMLLSLVLFRRRDFADATADLSTLNKVLAAPLAIFLAGAFLAIRGLPRRLPASLALYAGYVAVGIFSTMLSPPSGYAYWKLGELLMCFSVALYVLRMSETEPEFAGGAYDLWLAFLALNIVAVLVGALLYPGEALHSPVSDESLEAFGTPLLPIQLSGVLTPVNANAVGAMSAVLLFVQLCRLREAVTRRSHIARLAWIAVLACSLVLAQSRTAWAGFAVAVVVALCSARAPSLASKLTIFGAIATCLAAFLNQIFAYLTRGWSLQHLSSMSGRTEWWATALSDVANARWFEKLFGLGPFMAANRKLLETRLGRPDAGSLHSDYVDAVVSTGFVGATMLVLAVLALLWSARRDCSARRAELFGLTCMLVIRSITGTTFASHGVFLPALMLVSVLCAARSPVGAPAEHCGGALLRAPVPR